LTGPDDVSHKLIHIIVDTQDYVTQHINFASMYVSQKVAVKFADEQKTELRAFLSASDSLGALGSLRGQLFEGYAHNLLQRGGL
jgi:hypothetical protein